MTTKCTSLTGRIFGHKWVPFNFDTLGYANANTRSVWAILPSRSAFDLLDGSRSVCQRCGAVTRDKP